MKKRILACVLACTLLLMGTGYAYWTDLLQVSATAETGELDVKFSDLGYVDNNFTNVPYPLVEEKYYDSTSYTKSFNDNSVTLNVNDLYPGHYEHFKSTVQNVGTVAAKIGNINAVLSGNNSAAKDVIGVAVTATQHYDVTTTTPPHKVKYETGFWCWGIWIHTGWDYYWVPGTTTTKTLNADVALGLPAGSTFTIDGIVFVRLSALPLLDIADLDTDNILYLTNNSNMEFNIYVGMDSDAAGTYTTGSAKNPSKTIFDDSVTQNKTETVTLDFVWDQYNQK